MVSHFLLSVMERGNSKEGCALLPQRKQDRILSKLINDLFADAVITVAN